MSAWAISIARLCQDGSNRQPKFILPTLRDALARGLPVAGLALETALWCRYCAGTDEAGRTIAPDDARSADLRARALAAREDPAAFLSNAAVFGALGADATYARAFGAALASIWGKGVAVTLAEYVGA